MTATTNAAKVQNDSILPLLGAAMPSLRLAERRDWLMDGRDLELQDAVSHLVLDGDWRAHAAGIKTQLEGFPGRLGIHGPFWGLTMMASDPAVRAVTVARLTRGLEFAAELGPRTWSSIALLTSSDTRWARWWPWPARWAAD